MAGNIKSDNSGNIYVEFDYNNLIVVDPNKTIDAFGKIKERLVDHENLVMYANLEAELLPRTKLAVGGSPEDNARLVSVAKMNFLKPTKETSLGSGYYDELTGENSTKFKGQNQMLQKGIQPKNGDKPYIINQPLDLNNVVDNGLLGITQINITTNTSFVPSVKIELEDVQGKALFQLGDNSPYSAFFNLPYPQFYLTLKGYYGQAVRYQLNLEKFNARFNSFSGNYQVSLEFRGYKFNILNEIAMGHLLATPHMYGTRFDVKTAPVQSQQSQTSALSSGGNNIIQQTNGAISNSEGVTEIVTKKGYQKIVEVYSEYKAKGLVPPDFPELTLVQLMSKLENLEKSIMESFPKVEVEPLTNIRTYKELLGQYFNQIRGGNASWFAKYLNPRPLILENNDKVYVFKSDLDLSDRELAISELNKIVEEYTKGLASNPTLGTKGQAPIPNPIKVNTIVLDNVNINNINWVKTTTQQTGTIQPSNAEVDSIKKQYQNLFIPIVGQTNNRPNFFIFDNLGGFDKQISLIEAQANKKLSEYEALISDKLLKKLEDSSTGLGFKPTVRAIIAVIMASTEGFIRLMDEVHTNAWNVKYDPIRRGAILDNPSSAPSSDSRDHMNISLSSQSQNSDLSRSQIPVYPWPQFFVETPEDKKGRFQLKYIADPSVVDITKGYLYDKWPEVEFVEEYMVGLTQKFDAPAEPPPLDNERYTDRININAIEFPNLGLAYANKEEIKFFYEIWERQFVTARYSNLLRATQNQLNEIITLNVESETNNISKSLGVSSPYLSVKLKNYGLNASNYQAFLSNISNSGTGRAYQDFIRGFYVTPYLRNLTENSFGLLNALELGRIPQVSTSSEALESLIKTSSNQPLIIDTIPFTDTNWNVNNMANGVTANGTAVYNTNKTLKVYQPRKIISNFSDTYDFTTNRPVTNFSYKTATNPYVNSNDLVNNMVNIKSFYDVRVPNNFVPTEGYCYFTSPSKQLPLRTTTSILNTPYFVNSILNGVDNNRGNDPYPYVQSAYLFINSLPIATLKEKYKTLNGDKTEDLDYIASCFKKFGAIHKLPYSWVLKLGSNWHRYKRFKENGVDILRTAWSNFDSISNFSPILSSQTQTYSINYLGKSIKISLQNETSEDIKMTLGFYPKVINDFNYFYTGYDLYQNYTDEEIQNSVGLGLKLFNFSSSNINGKQGDKNLSLDTWSVLIPQLSADDVKNCNVVNNTRGTEYFVTPSFGSQINQTKYECFTGDTTNLQSVVDVTSNPSVYNGSVRTLWSSPNYGYFDNSQITYPQPDSYLNVIDPLNSVQSPMSLLNIDGYSKIEEIFSVFEKRILDLFEQEFLNFSKPLSNADITQQESLFLQSTANLDNNYRNFQGLFTSLMTVPAMIGNNESSYFLDTINQQYGVFTNGVKSFLEYDVIFKYGNPSNYRRRIWDSYLNSPTITNPITFEPYVPNSLPSSGGTTTLSQSRANNPQAWVTLETEVGFSTINGITYTSNGSYITDFFIDNNIQFTSQNITLLSPIIKMWATQKLKTPNLTASQFKARLGLYLLDETNLQNNFLNQILSGVQKKLPPQDQLPERTIKSVIQGEQSKVENYEMFKALNDKWIAGGDYTTKTLFEDILFLDRASRNVGETIIIDIFDLKNMLSKNSLNQAMSVFTFISGILIKNNFTVMNLPSYVNFYNVQDVDGTTTPQTEGSLEFANNMWGTFLDVDYRNSGPKMICFYAGKPSSYLDLPKTSSRFRSDSFEMIRASENPLIENQKNKKDWSVSNRCVGFNVDIGIRNQNMFYSFSVSQDSGVATSESINTQLNMVNQSSGRNTATQNVGLYNLYKQRSYKCNVVSLGNALIQPTMYFNLRHVPMFNGPYMITDVEHQIQPGNFQTTFSGIRQGIYDLPSIDNFLQSINQNLLTKLEELVKVEKTKISITATTDSKKSTEVVQKSNNVLDASNTCVGNVDTLNYPDYTVTTTTGQPISPKVLADAIKGVIPGQEDLIAIIYGICYVNSFVPSGKNNQGSFVGYNNNYANISLYYNFKPSNTFFEKSYCCVRVTSDSQTTKSQPLVAFKDVNTFIRFMVSRLEQNLKRIKDLGLLKYYVCYWPKSNVSESYFDSNISQYTTLRDTLYKGIDNAVKAKLIGQVGAEELKKDVKDKSKGTSGSSGTSGTSVCPPPTINSFSPISGYTGTIVQVNGTNLENVSGVTINGTDVNLKSVTIYNSSTMRISVPKIGNGTRSVGNIILRSSFGNSIATSLTQFTYDPTINPSSASSPGGYQSGEG
jgi:hypothetical protein